jgi:spermine oxidase
VKLLLNFNRKTRKLLKHKHFNFCLVTMYPSKWTVFALTFSINILNSFARPSNEKKIVIVGAGLSGISAAVKLIENGYQNVVIFEAEDRIGGRIHSVPFANGIIDLGAQWVHGDTNNAVYDLMHKYFEFGDTGTETVDPEYMSFGGKPASKEQVLHLIEIIEEILSSFEEQSKFNGTLGDFVIQKFWPKVQSSTFDPPDLPSQVLDLMHKEMNEWNGTETWFDMSAKLNTISDVNTGNQVMTWKDKGFSTIFDYLVVRVFTSFKNCFMNPTLTEKISRS